MLCKAQNFSVIHFFRNVLFLQWVSRAWLNKRASYVTVCLRTVFVQLFNGVMHLSIFLAFLDLRQSQWQKVDVSQHPPPYGRFLKYWCRCPMMMICLIIENHEIWFSYNQLIDELKNVPIRSLPALFDQLPHVYLYHLLPECYFPLGMENMKIDNAQITSSSVFGLHKPYYGRLNLLSFHGDPSRSAWCAMSEDKDPFLQVAFGEDTSISGVAVQGLSLFDNFITSFRLCYSNDGNDFQCVQESGNEKVSVLILWWVFYVINLSKKAMTDLR